MAIFLFPGAGESGFQFFSDICPPALVVRLPLLPCLCLLPLCMWSFDPLCRRLSFRPYFFLRMNCYVCRCRIGVYVQGGEFRLFLLCHLVPVSFYHPCLGNKISSSPISKKYLLPQILFPLHPSSFSNCTTQYSPLGWEGKGTLWVIISICLQNFLPSFLWTLPFANLKAKSMNFKWSDCTVTLCLWSNDFP